MSGVIYTGNFHLTISVLCKFADDISKLSQERSGHISLQMARYATVWQAEVGKTMSGQMGVD